MCGSRRSESEGRGSVAATERVGAVRSPTCVKTGLRMLCVLRKPQPRIFLSQPEIPDHGVETLTFTR